MTYVTTDVTDTVDLTAVRSYLSLNLSDTAEDPLLTALIGQARSILDEWLPFWTAMCTVQCITDAQPTIYLKGPVLDLSGVYLFQDDEWTDIKDDCTLTLEKLEIPSGVTGKLRIVYTTDGYCPAPVQTAVLMMVRTLYNDRNADPMTEAVMRIITPYIEVNV